MKTPDEADEAIKMLNGRWFAKKKITAETWDGKTKFEIEESEAEREKRLQKWNNFLENEDKKSSENQSAESTAQEVAKETISESTTSSASNQDSGEVSSNNPVSEDVQNG